jgi:hypothetical protein
LYGNGDDGVEVDNVASLTARISNNISSDNGGAAFLRYAGGAVADSHNCGLGAYAGPWSRTGSISADPRLTDAPAGNFTLQLTSPCIDAGVDLGQTADFAGQPIRDVLSVPNTGSRGAYTRSYVDIGAFEACDTCNSGGGCH